jgi:hypothetical protein
MALAGVELYGKTLIFKGALQNAPFFKLRFSALLAPKAQKLLPGEKLAKIFDF